MTTALINPPAATDPIAALLSAHGLRRTGAARRVLGWLLAHADTSFTHAQLQAALQDDTHNLDRVLAYKRDCGGSQDEFVVVSNFANQDRAGYRIPLPPGEWRWLTPADLEKLGYSK